MGNLVKEENEKELKEQMRKYKKIKNSNLLNEDFSTKDYIKTLSVFEARAIFKHRTKMSRYFQMNYKSNPSYAKQLWKCRACNQIDSESHILWCIGFKEIRENKNLKCDKDLCQYLIQVQKIREKQENGQEMGFFDE